MRRAPSIPKSFSRFGDSCGRARANFTAYDAAYVALAENLRAPLVTLDLRLARACPGTVRVETFA